MAPNETLIELSKRFDPVNRQVFCGGNLTAMLDPVPRIVCKDGFSMSVQAGFVYRCTPRDNFGPWTHVEIGFISEPEPLLNYQDREVYNFVPIELVVQIIDSHGGLMPLGQVLEVEDDYIDGEVVQRAEAFEHNPLEELFIKRLPK